jgi:hypothetical protein
VEQGRIQFILSDLTQSIQRRGWAELSSELANQIFPSASELNQFAHRHQCEIKPSPSGGVVFTRDPAS